MLSRDQIRAQGRAAVEIVQIKSLGEVGIRKLSLRARLKLKSSGFDKDSPDAAGQMWPLMVDVITGCIRDGDAPVFESEADLEDIDDEILLELFDACLRVNGMHKDSAEEAVKNSETPEALSASG